MRFKFGPLRIGLLVLVAVLLGGFATISASGKSANSTAQVTVPQADRFTPFGLTIHTGDSVKWTNNDEDDHTVVSDDAFNTTNNKGTNQLLPADGGTVTLRFTHPGQFVYYCGNFGTPMSGVITVLP
jgi:plastocyanin